jgi:hypothetical protein
VGQLGGPAFFLLHGEAAGGDLARLVDTPDRWRCWHDRSRRPIDRHVWPGRRPHCVVGAGERVRASAVPWGWQRVRFDDADWPPAAVVCGAAHSPWGNRSLAHELRPDPLPAMESRPRRLARVAEAPADLHAVAERWLRGGARLTVPPHRRVRLVLDFGELTNAYPVLTASGGAGAAVRLVSAEAPYIGADLAKGHRDETAGRKFYGQCDEFLPDGGRRRVFTTLWFRSLRYLELTVRTSGEPLVLDDLHVLATGFPLRRRAVVRVDGEGARLFDAFWDVSWRTARLCAHETFFDCPHYEQAQFPGDSRVQAVFHYLAAGDDRLARKAIDDFHASRLPCGLLRSHYPARRVQVIATYSLYWVGMLHDFRVYRGDVDFLRAYVAPAREVLGWFERRIRADGALGRVEYAPFLDWSPAMHCGNAPQDADGGSSILTLLLAAACRWQAGLEAACGFGELVPRWRRLARSLVRAAVRTCWDPDRRLLADTTARRTFSQHAQVQAVLAGAWPAARAGAVLRRAMGDPRVAAPGTHYFRYYVAQALKAAGRREGVFDLLRHWQASLETGLTTWPESDGNPRSDCHAWSVTPGIELVQTVLGVEPDPAADGFGRIRFAPTLGPLSEASGRVPTPHGVVTVRARRRSDGRVDAELDSPVPVVIAGRKRALRPGGHDLTL